MTPQLINVALSYANHTAFLIALVGVIIALLTLREMRKQRQKAYEPQLFLPNITVYMQKNDNGTPCILKSDWKRETQSLPFFNVELHNIGLGAANTITIMWRYDHKAIIAKLEALADQTKLLRINGDGRFEYLFSGESKPGYGFVIEPIENSKEEISFLTANQTINIKLAETLHYYLTFIPYLELAKQNWPRRIDLIEEICIIEFIYHDIGGKQHKQRIKMNSELYAYSKEFSDTNFALASLSFSRYFS